jgi:3-oxoacyl-[acyl-carrier-protein] synthase II
LGPLTALEQELPPGSTGGQAPDLPESFEPNQPREVRYLRRAIADALADAKIDPGKTYLPSRCGIMLGTTLHGMRAAGKFLRSNDHSVLSDFLAGATLRDAMADLPFSGFAATGCSACSSSLGSIALGVSLLRSGQLDLVIAGGYDTISEYVYAGFNSLRLVAPGPLRPFTRNRLGMKLAEGYGIVVLERAADAEARGIHPLAKILGYGESADAHHLTQPHPHGEGAARAIKAALESAGLTTGQIDLIAAHATGTPDNDAGEYAAFSSVFGADLSRVPVVAFKSHLGHTLGGAGAVELILSALCMRDQIVPGCANVKADEIEFPGLSLATGPACPAQIRATLNTSLGFGGANTCLILGEVTAPCVGRTLPAASPAPSVGRALPATTPSGAQPSHHGSSVAQTSDGAPASSAPASGGQCPPYVKTGVTRALAAASRPGASAGGGQCPPYVRHSSSTSPVYITGVGVVLPGMIGNDAFARAMTTPGARPIMRDTGTIAEAEYIDLLNARRVRRMSDYVKLSLAATMLACRDAGIADIPAFAATCSAILGSTHGSANYSEAYYQQIVREGIPAANPMLFAEGVPNAGAAHLSLMLSLKGPCQTIIGTRTAGLDALHLAATRIASGEWDRAIVSAAEEYSPLVNAAYGHWGLHTSGEPALPFSGGVGGFVAGCGAVTLVLESDASVAARGVKPRGRVVSSTGPLALFSTGRLRRGDIPERLRECGSVVCSANGTWLDRLEAAAIARRSSQKVTSLSGHLPEIHSVMSLAAIAAVLLTSRLPRLLHDGNGGKVNPASGKEGVDEFTVLCSDYSGLVSAAWIVPER